jgi:thiamine kinase-like enzyme
VKKGRRSVQTERRRIMPNDSLRTIHTAEDLDPAWLARALGTGPVASFSVEEIGTGQMSESHRISLIYESSERVGPARIVIKLAASDPTSRATGVGLGIYAREVRFYRELAPRIGGPLATCIFARYDETEGWFTLVLEDAAPAVPGDQIAGCTVEQARLAMRELARLHAPVFGDRALAASDWLNQPTPVNQALVSQLLPGFLDRYGDRIAPEHRVLCERFVASLDAWLAERRPPLGLVHGDFRLDNLLFGEPGSPRPLTVVDWQTVGWGGAMTDAAYFLGGGLQIEDRRLNEQELFHAYHEALLAHGVQEIAWEECWAEYRRHAFAGVLMAIVASMIVERTERGDEMFMTMLARHGDHALDLAADELLPRSGTARAAPLRPSPGDEGRHPPGPEQLWNESWYFDAIARDGSLGAYVRVGLYPNLGACWYTAFVCGPGRPTIAVIDFAAPLPELARSPGNDALRTQTGELRAEHRCGAPLERFSVALDAIGQAHEDPAALLRGESGRPVAVALDLVWETAGVPYAYRLTTRYEIPCAVAGRIRVGDEVIELAGAIGQRDHSWGTRDWWSMDWVWSAGHLDDGTHLHAVELRLPNSPTLGVGYVQSAGAELLELDHVAASEHLGADGLITAAHLSLDPAGLDIEIEPLAFGPLRLLAPDGRVSNFPRAMCRIRCADGRSGLAWVEWNLNQPDRAGRGRNGPP